VHVGDEAKGDTPEVEGEEERPGRGPAPDPDARIFPLLSLCRCR